MAPPSRCPRARPSCVPRRSRAATFPSSAPPIRSRPLVRAASAWWRSRAAKGFPGLVHHRGGGRHEGAHGERGREQTSPQRARALRLRASDGKLPRQQPMRARVACRRARHCRVAFRGRAHLARCLHAEARRRQQSVFPLRQRPVHRLLALRARLRRHARHVRAHHRRPWHRVARFSIAAAAVPRIRVCVLRCLRRGLSHRRIDGEVGPHRGPAATGDHHHLRLLRRGLFAGGRSHRRRCVTNGARTAMAARTRATPASRGDSRTDMRRMRIG